MPGLLPEIDPDGLLAYSVVFTDRALDPMSQKFQRVMRDISEVLRETCRARSASVVPGSGTFGREAVARQFATARPVLVIRNGGFSHRGTQVLETGAIASSPTVCKARPVGARPQAPADRTVQSLDAALTRILGAQAVPRAAA